MPSLIDQIVSLEKRASGIVEAAQTQAKSIANQAEIDLQSMRAEIDTVTRQRVEKYRAEAEAKLHEARVSAEADFKAAYASIGAIGEDAVNSQLKRIVARVKEV